MEYYKSVLKNYATFSGRARRKEYWMFVLWNTIVIIVIGIVFGILTDITNVSAFSAVSWIYLLAVLIPSLAVSVRRLHDIGKTGWWLLLAFIPIIGAIVLFVFSVLDSQPGDNQYGPNPKGISSPMAMPAATPSV
jgi:uncharacterized membrane protein YhaH (DUF805 family)